MAATDRQLDPGSKPPRTSDEDSEGFGRRVALPGWDAELRRSFRLRARTAKCAAPIGRAAFLGFLLGLACASPGPLPGPELLPPVEIAKPMGPVEPAEPLPRPSPTPRVEPTPEVVDDGPPAIRVGLFTDVDEVKIPCCLPGLAGSADGKGLAVTGDLVVRPAAKSAQPSVFRLQVAALKSEPEAEGLAARLGRLTGWSSSARFDAGSGLYRVRVGRFAERSEARAAISGLTVHGTAEAWVVSEGGGLEEPALRLLHRGKTYRVPGRELILEVPTDGDIAFRGVRYRGRLVVYLNNRGTLNVINELPLEDYLRGVVVREMGPALYPWIEALKAQSVAARTYVLHNLGAFNDEGYDVCATPRCQVYGGRAAEHSLSDRAIRETAGEVLLFDGGPIDALYSATCGGHTEDVEVVFPLKRAPYLKGVPCLEGGPKRIPGPPVDDAMSTLANRIAPDPKEGSRQARWDARFRALARELELPPSGHRLKGLDAEAVRSHLGAIFDLLLDARLFAAGDSLRQASESPPAEWDEPTRRLARALTRERGWSSDEAVQEVLIWLAVTTRAIERRPARFSDLQGGQLEVRVGDERVHLELPKRRPVTFRHGGGLRAKALDLLPGDRIWLWLRGEELLAVEQQVEEGAYSFDRLAKRGGWSRYRSLSQLRRQVQLRYPGFPLVDLEPLDRGVSGRVGRLRLLGSGGRSEDVTGLAVRWTLDLPDTRFTAVKRPSPDGEPGWSFSGRGWGHGVGLCQIGTVAMAQRGHDYATILEHYYLGATLGRLKVQPASSGRTSRYDGGNQQSTGSVR